MNIFPEQVHHDGRDWMLDEYRGQPIYVVRNCEPPDCSDEMPALEVAGHVFGPAYFGEKGDGLCYAVEQLRRRNHALDHAQSLREARVHIKASYRVQEHLLKLLIETGDDDEISALLEAFFLLERDRNVHREREKQARKALLASYDRIRDLNGERATDDRISDDEQVCFLEVGNRRADEICAERPDLHEKRAAVLLHDRQRRARRHRALTLIAEAGHRGGIAVLGPLDEEVARKKWTAGKGGRPGGGAR